MGPVVGGVSSTVCVVPGVVGDNSVPEGISCISTSSGTGGSDEASGKVGLEESLAEVDVDKVLAGVVVFEVEALEITVVPGVVGEWDTGGDEFLLGGVPIIVASDEGG